MIKILDQFVSDKIAAGEVIERPLSIVKELVENSIDAGASQIIVEIRNGGKSLIRVTDNGCGIPAGEVELAFERHATGKISTLADLNRIETLGFRGEALASIAAVSRLTIFTKTEDERIGTKLVLHGGRRISREEAGANAGTTILVEDVFYNTPARRKFMKSDAAEASVIIELVQKLALFYAGISFRMINNGTTIINTPGDGNYRNAIASIYPTAEYRNLIEIGNDTVHGFISNPGVTKSSRRGQVFFVNGRSVSSETIEKGIRAGYGDRLFSGFPIAILFITVDPETVDVNIHPNKREIKFLDEKHIIDEISSAISACMFSEDSIPEAVKEERKKRTLSLEEELFSEMSAGASDDPGIADTVIVDSLDIERALEEHQLGIKEYLSVRERPSGLYSDPVDNSPKGRYGETHTGDTNELPEDGIIIKPPAYRPFEFDEIKVRGYIFDTYIITQTGDTLYVLDQHAAHERILYEKLVDEYDSRGHLSQPMLTPLTLEVPADVYNADQGFINVLRRMGYDIDDFGANTYIIREIPVYMGIEEAANFARDFIENSGEADGRNSTVIDKLIMRSCKAAVKAHDSLSGREIEDLLTELSKCVNPFSCPHGRPTFIKITKYDVERAFKRK